MFETGHTSVLTDRLLWQRPHTAIPLKSNNPATVFVKRDSGFGTVTGRHYEFSTTASFKL